MDHRDVALVLSLLRDQAFAMPGEFEHDDVRISRFDLDNVGYSVDAEVLPQVLKVRDDGRPAGDRRVQPGRRERVFKTPSSANMSGNVSAPGLRR